MGAVASVFQVIGDAIVSVFRLIANFLIGVVDVTFGLIAGLFQALGDLLCCRCGSRRPGGYYRHGRLRRFRV